MNYKWLAKNNSDNLIVFFNGWGMDENVVSHLDCCGYDVVMFNDYNDLDIDFEIDNYKNKYIVAWSMGVMIASLDEMKFITEGVETVTAISGTPYPIDDNYGIPKRIYNITVKGFSPLSCKKFIERMGVEGDAEKVTQRSFENQKSELVSLLEYRGNSDFKYTGAIIPDDDVIIPTKNQLNYWNGCEDVKVKTVHSGHCPFLLYNKWTELFL